MGDRISHKPYRKGMGHPRHATNKSTGRHKKHTEGRDHLNEYRQHPASKYQTYLRRRNKRGDSFTDIAHGATQKFKVTYPRALEDARHDYDVMVAQAEEKAKNKQKNKEA